MGPMVMGYLVHKTHIFAAGLLYLAGSLFISGVLMLAVGAGQGNASHKLTVASPQLE